MTEWRVEIDQEEFEPNLLDVTVVDTFNPFGNHAIAQIEDIDGNRFDKYPRGTRVDFYYTEEDSVEASLNVESDETYTIEDGTSEAYQLVRLDGTINGEGTLQLGGDGFTKRFTGYVVERRENDSDGADALEVEAYSFDQFLRRNVVDEDLTGNTILEALQIIIEDYTPVFWESTNVTVGDDQTLTQSYNGEKVEDVLNSLSDKSVNEEFGVNEDVEFFWEPPESQPAPRDIDNTQWFNYDIPELGAEKINEVEVFYNGGDESVIVDDGSDKTELENSLGLSGPGTQKEEITREEITDISDARTIGEQYLDSRNNTLTGTVTTFGLNDAKPGDVINIEIAERGISGDFRIAEHEMRWGEDANIFTIVEKRGEQDDILVRMSSTIDRVEKREANRNRTINRITDTDVSALIGVSGDIDGASVENSRFVNYARSLVRDGWADQGNVDISHIAIGTDGSGLSRTNDSLNNEVARTTVTESLVGNTGVSYSGSFTQTGIEEVGLFDSLGNLIARGTFTATDVSGTVSVTIDVSDNPDVESGVLTQSGQETVRDIIADNTPSLPTQYAYGSDGTAPLETDTALGNEVIKTSIDEILLTSASTNTSWSNLITPDDTTPLEVQNDQLETLPVCDARDALDDNDGENIVTDTGDEYNDGQAAFFSQSGFYTEFNITIPYDLPSEHVGIKVRDGTIDSNANGELSYIWDGTTISSQSADIIFDWTELGDDGYAGGPGGYQSVIGQDLQAGETHTFRIEADSNTGDVVDCIAVYDQRFNFTFPNPDAATNGGGFLSGPELFPDNLLVDFGTANTRRDVPSARVNSTWNDVSGTQYIELSNDGGTNWIRTDNSETANVTFAEANPNVSSRVNMTRYGSRTTAFPTEGYLGQALSDWNLFAEISAIEPSDIGVATTRAIINPDTVTGTIFRESGQLDSSDTLLTHCTFAEFEKTADMRVESAESLSINNP